jgi:Zn-dependent protease
MNLFRVRGIQLAVHWTFLLLLVYVGIEGWRPDPNGGSPDGWMGVFWNVTLVLSFFVCVILHELGHSFTAMHFGVRVRRILLMPIGGMAEFDSIPRQPAREVLITLAGPAVNFAIAAALWLFAPRPAADSTAFDLKFFAELLFEWNLVMGCFNLVPVFPMDGGRLLRAALASRLPYVRATRIAATIGKALALVAVIVALSLPELHLASSRAYLPAALFCFITFAADLEYRAVKRREVEEAHWRAVFARLSDSPPQVDEPPLLSS